MMIIPLMMPTGGGTPTPDRRPWWKVIAKGLVFGLIGGVLVDLLFVLPLIWMIYDPDMDQLMGAFPRRSDVRFLIAMVWIGGAIGAATNGLYKFMAGDGKR